MFPDDAVVKCDVLVVGGGPAGIAASIAAARAGSSVVLLEKHGFLGGLATAGMVGTICGLYLRDKHIEAQYVCGGFAREFAERLSIRSGSKPVHVTDGLHVLPYDPWNLQRTADSFVRQAGGINLVFHGTLTSVDVSHGKVAEVKALVWDRMVSFRPSCVVDCTGEATVLYLSGAQVEEDNNPQAAAVVFSMDNIDVSQQGRLSILRDIRRAVKEGSMSPDCEAVSFVPSEGNENRISLKVNLPQASSEWNRLTGLELRAHGVIDELDRFLGGILKEARLSRIPAQVGVRSGRRGQGKAVVTEEDVLNCRKFPDGVACGAWPMEEWGQDIRPKMTFMPEREYYEIPIGCLIPETLNNVFMGGRCISASAKAIASARVIGTSLSTGWASGKAAAFQSKNRPLSAAVKELREEQVRGDIP